MRKKIEIKDIFGNVLFVHECENNSIKKTVEEAVMQDISLCMADLRCAYLRGANLCNAYLYGANLWDACLRDACLRGANLCDAYLRGANLYGANLSDAYLRCAYLRDACLRDACLRGANLCDAYLRSADLYGANLYGANLRDAYLRGVDLRDANLRGANLHCTKNEPFIPISCPSDGSFIGWKNIKGCLVKLLIPEDAKRSSATTNKCRCDKAKVLEIIDLTTNEHLDKIINEEYAKCVYRVGKMVYPDKFDKNRWKECSHGIHFFINKQEAVEYGF